MVKSLKYIGTIMRVPARTVPVGCVLVQGSEAFACNMYGLQNSLTINRL